jgi:hypothetical protein
MEVRLAMGIVVLPDLLLVVVIERGVVVTIVVQAKVSLVVAVVDGTILNELATSHHRSYSVAAAIERRYASRSRCR